VKGDVVVLPFPFSDLSGVKRRPALVITQLSGDDVILCQITSQARSDSYSVPLSTYDFLSGSLKRDSNIRPNRVFTADSSIVLRSVGRLSSKKIKEVIEKLIEIISV